MRAQNLTKSNLWTFRNVHKNQISQISFLSLYLHADNTIDQRRISRKICLLKNTIHGYKGYKNVSNTCFTFSCRSIIVEIFYAHLLSKTKIHITAIIYLIYIKSNKYLVKKEGLYFNMFNESDIALTDDIIFQQNYRQ